jgi:3-oxoacyl-[acyl-carrier protein] reductase
LQSEEPLLERFYEEYCARSREIQYYDELEVEVEHEHEHEHAHPHAGA